MKANLSPMDKRVLEALDQEPRIGAAIADKVHHHFPGYDLHSLRTSVYRSLKRLHAVGMIIRHPRKRYTKRETLDT